MEAGTFGYQAETNHQQEAQTEHHHGGVTVDKIGERLACYDHDNHGDNHRNHHHFHVFNHAHGGNHGIEREDSIQHNNLRDYGPKGGVNLTFACGDGLAFQALVHFDCGFKEEEYSAQQQD